MGIVRDTLHVVQEDLNCLGLMTSLKSPIIRTTLLDKFCFLELACSKNVLLIKKLCWLAHFLYPADLLCFKTPWLSQGKGWTVAKRHPGLQTPMLFSATPYPFQFFRETLCFKNEITESTASFIMGIQKWFHCTSLLQFAVHNHEVSWRLFSLAKYALFLLSVFTLSVRFLFTELKS